MVVERVWLHHVDYVEAIQLPYLGVRHSEVVPLSVTFCISIRREDQIVLELVDLNSATQVAALEARLKDKSVVIITLLLVERMEVSIFLLSRRTPSC